MSDLSKEFAIGIDIGGTNTKYGIVNHRGEILEKGELKTDAYSEIEDYVDALYDALTPLIQQHANGGNVKGIGIGAPNGNY
jgi:glucokinase